MEQRRRRRRRPPIDVYAAALGVVFLMLLALRLDHKAASREDVPETPEGEAVQTFLPAQSEETETFDPKQYPASLLALMERNPETESFVKAYPQKKNETPIIDLSEYAHCAEVPLLLQWDERWGYTRYGSDFMAITGCGPTCLSMVAIYLTGDTSLDPRTIADFAQQNEYSVHGSGGSWTLISEGGPKLGLTVEEVPLDKNVLFHHLEKSTPVIAIMGPGDFTDEGHFIVMTGLDDGKIIINDPNSPKRSRLSWSFEDIQDQILNLWACSK